MKIAYLSVTGNVKSFIDELGVDESDLIEISDNDWPVEVNEDFVLFVPTYDEYMTECVDEFLDEGDNASHCLGLVASGNRNFGEDGYIFTAKDLKKKYELPILHDFEYAGLSTDIEEVQKQINKLKGDK